MKLLFVCTVFLQRKTDAHNNEWLNGHASSSIVKLSVRLFFQFKSHPKAKEDPGLMYFM